VFPRTQSLVAGDLLFRYIESQTPRLGLIVSRKYGNAVHRGLFKRRCRALFREQLFGMNYTVLISPKSSNLSYSRIKQSFKYFQDKINVR